MDDKALLKLLEAGVETEAAASQLEAQPHEVTDRVKEFMEEGILRCNGDYERVDWEAYGKWAKGRTRKDGAGDKKGSRRSTRGRD